MRRETTKIAAPLGGEDVDDDVFMQRRGQRWKRHHRAHQHQRLASAQQVRRRRHRRMKAIRQGIRQCISRSGVLLNIIMLVVAVIMVIFWSIRMGWILSKTNNDHFDPTVASSSCQTIKPLDPPNLDSLTSERRQQYEAVREAIQHTWKGYIAQASFLRNNYDNHEIPPDDASPIANAAHSWLHYAATFHDALDTLYLAQLSDDYQQAVESLTSLNVQTTSYHPTKTFEYSLRIVGGLLGAYSLSGDGRLLRQAQIAADALLQGPFAHSPTVLPRMFDVLAPPPSPSTRNGGSISQQLAGMFYRWYASLYHRGRDTFTEEHYYNSLAGVGSFLEFQSLTTWTGDEKYKNAANAIFHHVTSSQYNHHDVMVPTYWNVMTGQAMNHGGMLGSGADSFYEYWIKQPILNGCATMNAAYHHHHCGETDQTMLTLYHQLVEQSIQPHHAYVVNDTLAYPVDSRNQFHHLLCFVPAMLALGDHELSNDDDDNESRDHLTLAKQLTEGCWEAYQTTSTGFAPEHGRIVHSHNNENHHGATIQLEPDDPRYLLRPEFVESLFVLYRVTKDVRYQDMAWQIFQHLQQHCRVDHGYAGLVNVYQSAVPLSLSQQHSSEDTTNMFRIDDTPSYFLAETLKYLLLIFGPDDYLSLDDFVLTTEAHPLIRQKRRGGYNDEETSLPHCMPLRGAPIPMPWTLIGIVVLILSAISSIVYYCCYYRHWIVGSCAGGCLGSDARRRDHGKDI